MLARFASALAALAFGFLLLAALEGLLRITGVGSEGKRTDPFSGFSSNTPMFEAATRADGTPIYRLSSARNSRSARQIAPEPQREFLAEAPDPGFRVFVIGGSSAAGVPYSTNYAFSAWLEQRLQAALPERSVEVVNAALSGYASRRLLPVVREIAQYDPDLLIVYMGHNEWAERQYYAHLIDMDPRLFAVWEWSTSLRLYQLIAAALGSGQPQAPPVETDARVNSQQMFAVRKGRAAGVGYASERDLEYRDLLYRFNLEEMIAAMDAVDARVMLLSLSQNFSDWAPGASRHRELLDQAALASFDEALAEGRALEAAEDCEAALARYEDARKIDDGHAELHFRIASCHRARGRSDEARRHFRRASDLDQVPHGAPTAFNTILAELAQERGSLFVDVDELLEAAAPLGLVGDGFFVDFVHPNLTAHQLIAAAAELSLRSADLPVASAQWRAGAYRDPDPAELLRAQPLLRERELEVRLFSCELALREDCAAELTRELLALDPQNEVAIASQRRRSAD